MAESAHYLNLDYSSYVNDKIVLYKLDIARYLDSSSGKYLLAVISKCFQSHLLELSQRSVDELNVEFIELTNDDDTDDNISVKDTKSSRKMEGKLKRVLREKAIPKAKYLYREEHVDTIEEREAKRKRLNRINTHITFLSSVFLKCGANPITLSLPEEQLCEVLHELGLYIDDDKERLIRSETQITNLQIPNTIGFIKFCAYITQHYYRLLPTSPLRRLYYTASVNLSSFTNELALITVVRYLEYERRRELIVDYLSRVVVPPSSTSAKHQYLNQNDTNKGQNYDNDQAGNSSFRRLDSSVLKELSKSESNSKFLFDLNYKSPRDRFLDDLHETRRQFLHLCMHTASPELPIYPLFYEVAPIALTPTGLSCLQSKWTRSRVNKGRQVTDNLSSLSNVTGTLKPGHCILVEQRLGFHLLIDHEHTKGWIQSKQGYTTYFRPACSSVPDFSWACWVPFYRSTYYQVYEAPQKFFEHIELKVRKFPTEKSEIVGYLKAGDVVRSRGVLGDWLHIEFESHQACWMLHTARRMFISEKVPWEQLPRATFPESLRYVQATRDRGVAQTLCDQLYKRVQWVERRVVIEESPDPKTDNKTAARGSSVTSISQASHNAVPEAASKEIGSKRAKPSRRPGRGKKAVTERSSGAEVVDNGNAAKDDSKEQVDPTASLKLIDHSVPEEKEPVSDPVVRTPTASSSKSSKNVKVALKLNKRGVSKSKLKSQPSDTYTIDSDPVEGRTARSDSIESLAKKAIALSKKGHDSDSDAADDTVDMGDSCLALITRANSGTLGKKKTGKTANKVAKQPTLASLGSSALDEYSLHSGGYTHKTAITLSPRKQRAILKLQVVDKNAPLPLIHLLSDKQHAYLNHYITPSPCRLTDYDMDADLSDDEGDDGSLVNSDLKRYMKLKLREESDKKGVLGRIYEPYIFYGDHSDEDIILSK